MKPIVKVVRLNTMAYMQVLAIQRQTMREIHEFMSAHPNDSDVPHRLILAEHSPVFTTGIRDHQYDRHVESTLTQLGAHFVRTNRGGLITFHGFGQLLAYPIIYLGSFSRDKSIKRYVRQLENTVINTCLSFGIKAAVIDGLPGVWIDNERKISAIGVSGSRYVTMHGLSVNCNVDLKWFDHIIPCEIPDKSVTSFSRELNTDISIDRVIPYFLDSFSKVFDCTLI